MKFTREQALLLGLTPQETTILEAIATCTRLGTPANFTTLAKRTKLARSSVTLILERLKKRGWVVSSTQGKRLRWDLASSERLTRILERLAGSQYTDAFVFSGSGCGDYLRLKCGTYGDVIIHRGQDQLCTVYEKIANSKRNTRIQALQPLRQLQALAKKIPPELNLEINERIVKNEQIIDGIIPRDYYHHLVKEMSKTMLKSFEGRSTEMHLLEDIKNPDEVEYHIVDNRLYIINWEDELALETSIPGIVSLKKYYFELQKQHTRHVDQHQLIKRLLEQE